MKAKFLLFGCALLLAAPGAGAAPAADVLNGSYLYNIIDVCGLAAKPWPSGVTKQFDGSYSITMGTLTFDSATGMATAAGQTLSDQIIVPNSTACAISQNPLNGTSAYTNTGKELTIFGETYKIAYGVISSGVVKNFVFVGTSTTSGLTKANCVARGVADLIN